MRTVLLRESHPPVVAVNGAVIPGTVIAREVQYHSGDSPQQSWQDATRALIIRELLLQRARTLNLRPESDSAGGLRETEEEALVRAVLDHDVHTPSADDDSCKRYYQSNLARFRSPDLYEPRHILFQANRSDEAAYAQALAKAESVLVTVTQRPDSFARFARDLSDCPSRQDGGLLGQVVAGETTPEFDAALRRLRPGQTCGQPVCTRYGVHVLRLERKTDGRTLPYGEVRDRIATYLLDRSWRRAVAQYVSHLAGAATITGFQLPGAMSPLVQ